MYMAFRRTRLLLVVLGILVFATATIAPGKNANNGTKAAGGENQQAYVMQTQEWTGEDLLFLFIQVFIGVITTDGPLADVLDLATEIAVGVERSAIGNEDTPLDDLVAQIEARYGSAYAATVESWFDSLVDYLGPDLLADVEPIVLIPDFDIDNGRADEAAVWLPDSAYIVDMGNGHNVGNGEFARVILGLLDRDDDDADAEQLLAEITGGRSGANLDFEFEAGIVGVHLVDLSLLEYTLEIEDGAASDFLTLYGPGVEAAIANLDAPANLMDFYSDLSLVEVGVEPVKLGRWWRNPIRNLVGRRLSSPRDVQALLEAGLAGDPRVELIGFDEIRITLIIHNRRTGSSDTLVLFGATVEKVLTSYNN